MSTAFSGFTVSCEASILLDACFGPRRGNRAALGVLCGEDVIALQNRFMYISQQVYCTAQRKAQGILQTFLPDCSLAIANLMCVSGLHCYKARAAQPKQPSRALRKGTI